MVALSDAFVAVAIALFLLYKYMYNHQVRWLRMVGCFAIMMVSVGLGTVEDSIPMFILMSANFIIAGTKFLIDIGSLGEVIR